MSSCATRVRDRVRVTVTVRGRASFRLWAGFRWFRLGIGCGMVYENDKNLCKLVVVDIVVSGCAIGLALAVVIATCRYEYSKEEDQMWRVLQACGTT